MKTALITLSGEGVRVIRRIAAGLPDCDLFAHEITSPADDLRGFDSIVELTRRIFHEYRGLVFVAPCGVVVRALAPCVDHKLSDPAVVVLDVGARWAVSLLSGHEGGANDLAVAVSNIVGAEPVISTTTEAIKTLVVGIGCRAGTPAHAIVAAIQDALETSNVRLDQVRLLASADIKQHEPGLLQAAKELGLPARFIASEEIRASQRDFARSEFVENKVNLPAVAEPAALLAGRRTRLLLPKTTYDGITIAIAVENCMWSE